MTSARDENALVARVLVGFPAGVINPGDHAAKGEELGRYSFGGATHCLMFRAGAPADVSLPTIPRPHAPLILVNSQLATANR